MQFLHAVNLWKISESLRSNRKLEIGKYSDFRREKKEQNDEKMDSNNLEKILLYIIQTQDGSYQR